MTDMRDNIARIVADEKNGGDPYDIAEDIMAALPGMVAPLVWRDTHGVWRAKTPWGDYKVYGRILTLPLPMKPQRVYSGEAESKAAAQAHHAAAVVGAFTGSKQ